VVEASYTKKVNALAKSFILKHPNPKDELVHKFAGTNRIKIDRFEEALYKVASKKRRKK
jgi:hypothetical protein